MTSYVCYETATGNIRNTGATSVALENIAVEDGLSIIEGAVTSKTHYVSEGKLIAYTDEQKQVKSEFKGAGWAWSNSTMSWQVTDAAMANKFALMMLRIKRDELLAQSDYTQMPDVVLSNQDEWDSYRQALRDLPANNANALSTDDIVWPTPPSTSG